MLSWLHRHGISLLPLENVIWQWWCLKHISQRKTAQETVFVKQSVTHIAACYRDGRCPRDGRIPAPPQLGSRFCFFTGTLGHTQKLVKQETVSLALSDLSHDQMAAHMTYTLKPMHAIPKQNPEYFQWEGNVDVPWKSHLFWHYPHISEEKKKKTMKATLNNVVSWSHISQQASLFPVLDFILKSSRRQKCAATNISG